MNSDTLPHILRFIGFFLIQVLVLQNIEFNIGILQYFHPMIYPLFIIMLPIKTPVSLSMLWAFLLGLCIDYFSSSFGMHAGAAVFVAYCRGFILNFMEPRGGYNVAHSPNAKRYSTRWFFQFCAVLLALHHLFFFILQYFAPIYALEIILNTLGSLLVSFLLVVFFQFIFDPQE